MSIDQVSLTIRLQWEPLIVDPPNKGHNRYNLSTKDASLGPKCSLSHSSNTFSTSLQRTKWLVPTCPLFRGSAVYCGQHEKDCVIRCPVSK